MAALREAVASREVSRLAHRHTKKVVRRCSGFVDSGVEGGGVKGGVEGGSSAYEEGGDGTEVGQPDGAKPRDCAIRVSRQRGYSPYTRSFLVSAELCQPIPIMILLVSTDLIQSIPIIFHIGWVTSADTNKHPPINTTHTLLFQSSTTMAAATIPIEISFF
jgi:hypothetical protein